MEHLVLSWLIWQVTRSPLPLALVLVFNNLPRPLCSPFAGPVSYTHLTLPTILRV